MKLSDLKHKTIADHLGEIANPDCWSSFICSDKEITSLKGSPTRVRGAFYCDKNLLTSLEGGPEEVSLGYYCQNNNLVNLKGASKTCGGSFMCEYNNLTSLEGAPSKVTSFYCYDNELISLAHAPLTISNTFWCDNKLPLMKFLMTSAVKKLHSDMHCYYIVNLHLKGRPLTRREMLQLQQELIDAGFEEEARL